MRPEVHAWFAAMVLKARGMRSLVEQCKDTSISLSRQT